MSRGLSRLRPSRGQGTVPAGLPGIEKRFNVAAMRIIHATRVSQIFSLPISFILSAALSSSFVHPLALASTELAGDVWPKSAIESEQKINGKEVLDVIKVLASDRFEGRAPGTAGETLTVDYLTKEFKTMGLKPGNPDGTYIQRVPMIGATSSYTASFTIGKEKQPLKSIEDIVAVSHRQVPEVKVENSELVFVGYGVVAPEYGWDDYKGVDLHGKTAVVLIGDPPVADPKDPTKLDDKMFKGKAMTYYGRWTYKYEMAAKMGASAMIIVHETDGVGYPYEVVISSNTHENFDIKSPDKNLSRAAVEAWITLDRAKRLFRDVGQDFDRLKLQALSKDFKPIPLKSKFNIDLKQKQREIESKNVIAMLPGSAQGVDKSYLFYSAHWDHLGRDPKLKGDQIFNGALDNASGVAAVVSIAKAFKRLPHPPSATVLFLIPTAEEKGMIGSKYYASHPLYPLAKTRADINIDGANFWGRTSDVAVVGFGNSTLDDILTLAAKTKNQSVVAETQPEKGMFYRSDHFNFANVGVPATMTRPGSHFIGQSEDYGKKKQDEYTANDYHKVSDEIKPDWDLESAAEDVRLWFQLGFRVANASEWPVWNNGNEFKATREESLRESAN